MAILTALLLAIAGAAAVLIVVWTRPLPGVPTTTDPCSIIAMSATEASSVSLARVFGCEVEPP